MTKTKQKPLLVIVGQTASGKTDLALYLARAFHGEIVNADSRQIYQKATIGTVKPKGTMRQGTYFVQGIPHHLMNTVSPARSLSVAAYKTKAIKLIRDIQRRKKLPILVGGTGLYVRAVVENFSLPKVKAQQKLREKLAKKSLAELQNLLRKHDPKALRFIDLKNPRRIIRALEITLTSGSKYSQLRQQKGAPLFATLEIAPKVEKSALINRIERRVKQQLRAGLEKEARNIFFHYGKKAPVFQSIGYREFVPVFEGHGKNRSLIAEAIIKNTKAYAKRQMTWFKKDSELHWVNSRQEAKNLTRNFLRAHHWE